MTGLDFVGIVERESAAFARAISQPGATDRPVRACPGWTVRDLVAHLGEVQRFWAEAVRAAGDRPGKPEGVEPGDRDLAEWYGESRATLVTALRDAGPDAPCWAWWAAGQTVAEVARRQAHEAAVHRVDGELAVGAATPLDADLAGDGVDEFFERMMPTRESGWTGPEGTVALAATDTGRVWTVRLAGRGPTPGDGEPDATVRATASDLDLLLWRRCGTDAPGVRVDGAADLAAALIGWADLD